MLVHVMPHAETIRVGPQGRIVIPAAVRKQLQLAEGSELRIAAVEGRLILEPPSEILARLRRRFAQIPAGTSLAGELIRERRAESVRELGE